MQKVEGKEKKTDKMMKLCPQKYNSSNIAWIPKHNLVTHGATAGYLFMDSKIIADSILLCSVINIKGACVGLKHDNEHE